MIVAYKVLLKFAFLSFLREVIAQYDSSMQVDYIIFFFLQLNFFIVDPPETIEINGEPRNLILMEGEKLNLTCSVDSKPSSTYQWYFKGKLF